MGAPSESRRRPSQASESRGAVHRQGMLYPSRAGGDSRVGLPPRIQRPCLSRGGRRRGERVLQRGQGTQSRARALDGAGALLTTRWAAYRRGFDSRWQPRVVHARKHTCGCPARNLFRRPALSLESTQGPVATLITFPSLLRCLICLAGRSNVSSSGTTR